LVPYYHGVVIHGPDMLASRVGAGQLLAARGRDCMKQPDDASASFDAQKDDLYRGRGRAMAASTAQCRTAGS